MKNYTEQNEVLLLLTQATQIKVNNNYYPVKKVEIASHAKNTDCLMFDIITDNQFESRFALCDSIDLYEGIIITDFTCNHVMNNSYGHILLHCKELIIR